SRGHRPYIQQEEFKKALEFQPDLVVIHLGLNDTDPRNWPMYGKDFIRDYAALIDSFRNLESQPRIWICKMTPIFHGHSRFKSGTRDWFWQIQEKITTVAHGQQTGRIDFQRSEERRGGRERNWLGAQRHQKRAVAETGV